MGPRRAFVYQVWEGYKDAMDWLWNINKNRILSKYNDKMEKKLTNHVILIILGPSLSFTEIVHLF